jgi:hypothetical protein
MQATPPAKGVTRTADWIARLAVRLPSAPRTEMEHSSQKLVSMGHVDFLSWLGYLYPSVKCGATLSSRSDVFSENHPSFAQEFPFVYCRDPIMRLIRCRETYRHYEKINKHLATGQASTRWLRKGTSGTFPDSW